MINSAFWGRFPYGHIRIARSKRTRKPEESESYALFEKGMPAELHVAFESHTVILLPYFNGRGSFRSKLYNTFLIRQ